MELLFFSSHIFVPFFIASSPFVIPMFGPSFPRAGTPFDTIIGGDISRH